MSEDLRDRIERKLCMFFDENYDGHLYDASQAIIDEFGMTTKHRRVFMVGTDIPVTETRIVGKWERCE